MNKKLTVWVAGGLLAFTVVGYNFFCGSVAKASEESPTMGMQGSMMQNGKMMNSEEMIEKCNVMMQDPDMQSKMKSMMEDGKMSENMKGVMENTSYKETASTEASSTDNMDHNAHHSGQV